MCHAAVTTPVSTRTRILDAAIRRFARFSYEETGLRDIAEDVGVDVAYVHRSFGSKERLFAEAIRTTAQADRILAHGTDSLAARLANRLVTHDSPPVEHQVKPLDIAIRSLSSPAAAPVLRGFVMDEIITPLGAMLEPPDPRRAALVMALLAGMGILRDVLQIGPFVDGDDGELETLLTEAIATLMGKSGRLES